MSNYAIVKCKKIIKNNIVNDINMLLMALCFFIDDEPVDF